MRSVERARRAGLATVLFAATAGSLSAPRRRGESGVMNVINRTGFLFLKVWRTNIW